MPRLHGHDKKTGRRWGKGWTTGSGPAPKTAPPPARGPRRVTYGGDHTWHRTGAVDVEVDRQGQVVSVWFRCRLLPFTQTLVDFGRAGDMENSYKTPGAGVMPIHSITFEEG